METRKLILYFALGLVCFSLWTAWHRDYPTQQTATTAAETSNTAATNNSATSAPQSQAPATVVDNKISAHRLVHVITDTLQVSIDTKGGNVVATKLVNYPVSLKQPHQPVQILSHDLDKLYIAQSGLLGINNNKPLIYSVARHNYTLPNGQKQLTVNLKWQNSQGVKVTKSFVFTAGSYAVTVNYKINNAAATVLKANSFSQILRKKSKTKSGFFGLHTYSGAAVSSAKKPYEKISYKDMDEKDMNRTVKGGWVAMQQRYFLTAWIPNQQHAHKYYTKSTDSEYYTVGVSTPITVQPKSAATITSKLYVGPEIAKNLKPLAKGLDLTIDYGWLWLLSVAIFWVMQHINNFVGNWGWSIIIVTVLIKLIFYPFSKASYTSMAKMRALAPKMKALKERYGGDKQKMSQATMELYRTEKVNPLGGCLPIVIQIPVFIALYYVLIEAVQLRQAPWIFWIHDLSAHDPYYILPILMGLTMFIQQRLNPAPPDPTQAKVMMFLPIIFTLIFLAFPAGLVLYWLVNNILSVLQQWQIMRKYEQEQAVKQRR